MTSGATQRLLASFPSKGQTDVHAIPFMRRTTGQHDDPRAVPTAVHDALHSPGEPLEAGVRRRMESGFHADFSSVRVHTNERAARSALSVNANAYASGQDIVFAPGRFAPHSGEGQRLLAHELAHVVEDGGRTAAMPSGWPSTSKPRGISDSPSPSEIASPAPCGWPSNWGARQ